MVSVPPTPRSRRVTRRFLSRALIPAALLSVAAPFNLAVVQRGGRGNDSTGRGGGLPLNPSKPLKFTTDEGTWLSLDVSPDGKSIVFVSDRSQSDNLWIVNADGSSPRALTRENDQAFQSPTYTPDGKFVIASPGNDLYMYYANGGTSPGIRLTGDTAAAGGRGAAPGGGRDGATPNVFLGAARAATAGTSSPRCGAARAADTTRRPSAGRSACSIARPGAFSPRRTPSAAACAPARPIYEATRHDVAITVPKPLHLGTKTRWCLFSLANRREPRLTRLCPEL